MIPHYTSVPALLGYAVQLLLPWRRPPAAPRRPHPDYSINRGDRTSCPALDGTPGGTESTCYWCGLPGAAEPTRGLE